MATRVTVAEAKARLSALLAAVEAGEDVVIARGDHDVARLVPVRRPAARELGFVPVHVPATFDDPLPGDEPAASENGATRPASWTPTPGGDRAQDPAADQPFAG